MAGLKTFASPPNYGRQRVDKVAPATSVAGVYGLGKLAGGTPSDRRGRGSNGVRVRGGRK